MVNRWAFAALAALSATTSAQTYRRLGACPTLGPYRMSMYAVKLCFH